MEEALEKLKASFNVLSSETNNLMLSIEKADDPSLFISKIDKVTEDLKIYDEDYSPSLEKRLEGFIERIKDDLPKSLRDSERDAIERKVRNGIKITSKYLSAIRRMVKALKEKIKSKDYHLAKRYARIIRETYVYSEESRLNSVFTQLELLNQLVKGLDAEKLKISNFLKAEYKQVLQSS